jgi:hypothetical protein
VTLAFYCLFSFFLFDFFIDLCFPLIFRSCFVPVFFAHVVSSLAYPTCLGIKGLVVVVVTIRPAMLYGAECCPTKWWHVQQLSVAEMCMLRWICGHTRRDRVWNDVIRERLGVAPVKEKLVRHRLRWFGHIQRRPVQAPIRNGVIRRTGNKRGRGRPNLTWEESVKRDLKDWCITKELALDRREWKLAIHVAES